MHRRWSARTLSGFDSAVFSGSMSCWNKYKRNPFNGGISMRKMLLLLIVWFGMSCADSALRADFYPDGRIDFRDFAVLASQWLSSCSYPCAYDLNSSGQVGFYELVRLSDKWLLDCPPYTAAASSTAASSNPAFAVDRNFTTRWTSAAAGTQWLQIDLGRSRIVKGLQLYWHMNSASAYRVYTSMNPGQWNQVYSVQNAPTSTHFIAFNAHPARAVKIECLTPFAAQAYSLHQIVVETDDECSPDDDDWVLVWSDEFDKPYIDPANWSHQIGGGGWGNNELQYYTDSSANSYIEDGKLVIKAVRLTQPVGGRNYTSARIRSAGKQSFVYGKLEARIKIPSGQGIWPEFWMMPENSSHYGGGWPACGEIDIMESINVATGIHGTIHFGSQNPYSPQHTGGGYNGPGGSPTNFGDNFHIYTIIWEPHRIRWYCDGVLYSTKTANQWWTAYSSDPKSPFDKPFHFIFNVAVGGNWPGFNIDDSLFPHTMEIDWVRVYQKPF